SRVGEAAFSNSAMNVPTAIVGSIGEKICATQVTHDRRGMGADRAEFASAKWLGTALRAAAWGCGGAGLSAAHRLALAAAAARLSEPLDGAALLLHLAGGGAVGDDQFPAAATSTRTSRARGQSVGRGDRQPIHQNHRKRRPARV